MGWLDLALNDDPVAIDRLESKTVGSTGLDIFSGVLDAVARDRDAERRLTLARADLDARQSRDDKLFSLQLKQLTPATAPLPTTAGGLAGLPASAAPSGPTKPSAGLNPMVVMIAVLAGIALLFAGKQIVK